MSDKLFLGIYRFSGVPYHRWFYTANKHSAMFAARMIASRRSVDVPSERTELVKLYEIETDITKERADQYVQQMRDERKKKGYAQPEDIDAHAPDRMLYQPVTENARLKIAGWPSDFRI